MLRQARVIICAVEETVATIGVGKAESGIEFGGTAYLKARVQEKARAFGFWPAPGLQQGRIAKRSIGSDCRQRNTCRQ